MADLLKLKPGLRAKRILTKYLPTVPDVIKANLVLFNNRLVAKGLVAEGVYDPQNRIYSSLESASTLYQACMATVESDPSKFFTLMDVLIEYPLLENAVKEMKVAAVQEKLMAPWTEFVPQEVPHGGARQRPRGRDIEDDGGDASRPAQTSTEDQPSQQEPEPVLDHPPETDPEEAGSRKLLWVGLSIVAVHLAIGCSICFFSPHSSTPSSKMDQSAGTSYWASFIKWAGKKTLDYLF